MQSQFPQKDRYRRDIRFAFSTHALVRLGERCKTSPETVIAMLEDGAFLKLARRINRNKLVETAPWTAGKTLLDIKNADPKINLLDYTYKHLMLWSEPDQIPLTLIVSVKTKTIVTVLVADDFDGWDWSDLVNEGTIQKVKEIYESKRLPKALRPSVTGLYTRGSWIRNDTNMTQGKSFTGLADAITELPVPQEQLLSLAKRVIEIAGNARDHVLQVIQKTKGTNLIAEYAIEKHNDEIQLVPVSIGE